MEHKEYFSQLNFATVTCSPDAFAILSELSMLAQKGWEGIYTINLLNECVVSSNTIEIPSQGVILSYTSEGNSAVFLDLIRSES